MISIPSIKIFSFLLPLLRQVKDETIVRLTNQMHELELSSAALASTAAASGGKQLKLSATSGSSDGYSPKMTSNGIR